MTDNVFDFDTEYMTEGEVEAALDAMVTAVGEAVDIDNSRTSIVNPFRMQQLACTYKILKFLMRDSNARVTYTLHSPYQSMGYITICGKNIVFYNVGLFSRAIELASNFEVYDKTNGEVEMNFTFLGLTKPVE